MNSAGGRRRGHRVAQGCVLGCRAQAEGQRPRTLPGPQRTTVFSRCTRVSRCLEECRCAGQHSVRAHTLFQAGPPPGHPLLHPFQLFLVSPHLIFLLPHLRETHYASFRVWFMSPNIPILSVTHVSTGDLISFFFTTGHHPAEQLDHISLGQPMPQP